MTISQQRPESHPPGHDCVDCRAQDAIDAAMLLPDHDVRHDMAGFTARPRLTCYSPGCDATLVAQPYMTQAVFDAEVVTFMASHPATIVRCADKGGPTMAWDGAQLTRQETA